MKSVFVRCGLMSGAAFIVAIICLTTAPVFAVDKDTKAVRAANDSFYSALNKLFVGEVSPMKKVWSHSDDIVNMGPDGLVQTGWKDVISSFEEQAAKKLGGKVTPKDVKVVCGEKLAVVHGIESGANKSADGKSLPVSIRVTNVFRREGKSWKLVGHQTDKLSFLKKK